MDTKYYEIKVVAVEKPVRDDNRLVVYAEEANADSLLAHIKAKLKGVKVV